MKRVAADSRRIPQFEEKNTPERCPRGSKIGSRWRERTESNRESEAIHLQHVAPATIESRHFGQVSLARRGLCSLTHKL